MHTAGKEYSTQKGQQVQWLWDGNELGGLEEKWENKLGDFSSE